MLILSIRNGDCETFYFGTFSEQPNKTDASLSATTSTFRDVTFTVVDCVTSLIRFGY